MNFDVAFLPQEAGSFAGVVDVVVGIVVFRRCG